MTWLYIVICGCLFEAVFIRFEYAKRPVPAVILKAIASLLFVSLGAICLSASDNTFFSRFVLAGLVFGALGDVLLNLRQLVGQAGQKVFMAGIAAFFIGHLLYIAALTNREVSALLVGIPVCAVLSATVLPWMLKRIEVTGKLKVFGIVYVALVFLMAGCAVGLTVLEPYKVGNLLLTIGAALFALSDVILIFYLFGTKKHITFRALNLSAYYIGQLLIALSIMLVTK